MKVEISKEWCERMARLEMEHGGEIGAGCLPDPVLAALRITHPAYCELYCPSVFTSPKQPRHTAECVRIAGILRDAQ